MRRAKGANVLEDEGGEGPEPRDDECGAMGTLLAIEEIDEVEEVEVLLTEKRRKRRRRTRRDSSPNRPEGDGYPTRPRRRDPTSDSPREEEWERCHRRVRHTTSRPRRRRRDEAEEGGSASLSMRPWRRASAERSGDATQTPRPTRSRSAMQPLRQREKSEARSETSPSRRPVRGYVREIGRAASPLRPWSRERQQRKKVTFVERSPSVIENDEGREKGSGSSSNRPLILRPGGEREIPAEGTRKPKKRV